MLCDPPYPELRQLVHERNNVPLHPFPKLDVMCPASKKELLYFSYLALDA